MTDGPESILSNPASLPGIAYPEVSVGFLVAQSSFEAFPDLYWDTNRDGQLNDADEPLHVDPEYDPVHGALIGGTIPLAKNLTVGLGLFLPKDRLLRLATFEPTIPTYFLYANRAQRYELGVGLGWRPRWGLAIGGGIQMIPRAKYKLEGTLDVTVEPAQEGDADAGDVVSASLDVHRMELDLVAGFAPNLAFHWDAGEAFPALDGLQVGAAWRGEAGLPVDVDIDLQVNASTGQVGDLDEIVVPLLFACQLGVFDHYVPEQWTVGVAYGLPDDVVTFSADLRRTAWDQMEVSVAQVVSSSIEGVGVDFGEDPLVDGNPYAITLKPTWAPRVGIDLRVPPIDGKRFGPVNLLARGGVGREPSPLVSQGPTSAFLDAGRWVWAVGAGVEHDDPFRKAIRRRVRWDGYFQYHRLDEGELSRPEPDEPTAGYPVGGAPIPIGGHLLAAGLQWSFEY